MNVIRALLRFIFRFFLVILLLLIIVPVLFGTYRYVSFNPTMHGIPTDQAFVQSFYESDNPNSYDPHQVTSANDMGLIYSGLVALDAQSRIIPDIAKKWDISADGKVYTFHLRDNVKFHNGRSVTSQDIKYSLERASSPELKSISAPTYLNDIEGFSAYHSGTATVFTGLRIIDDKTIEITIDAPKPYFLYKLTYPVAYVVDKQNIDQGKDWYRHPNGTGPYKLTKWEAKQFQIYEANKDFYLGAAKIPYLVFAVFDQYDQSLYEQDMVDIARAYSIERFMQESEPLHNELHVANRMCTSYIVLDVTKPPFDDVHVRRALSMATNRNLMIEKMYDGLAIANTGLYPQGMPGYDMYLDYLPYDTAMAQNELQKSKYANTAIELEFTDSGFGRYSDAEVAMYGRMWSNTLGITTTVHNIEYDYFYEKVNAGEHGQLLDGGWCADYPDPENFADALFRTGASQNESNYSNPALDALLDKARVEQDVQKRIALYQEAERIIVQDAPVIFTATPTRYYLVKPYVNGYSFNTFDTISMRNMSLTGKKWHMFKTALYYELLSILNSDDS